jgi:hypothetical protein
VVLAGVPDVGIYRTVINGKWVKGNGGKKTKLWIIKEERNNKRSQERGEKRWKKLAATEDTKK